MLHTPFPPRCERCDSPSGRFMILFYDHTLDGLVSGALAPDDAPPEYRGVAWSAAPDLAAHRDQFEVEAGAVVRITAAVRVGSPTTHPRTSPRRRRPSRPPSDSPPVGCRWRHPAPWPGHGRSAPRGRGAGSCGRGLDHVGITVPSPNEASNGHTDVRGEVRGAHDGPGARPRSSHRRARRRTRPAMVRDRRSHRPHARRTRNGVDKGAQIFGPGEQWPEPCRRGAPEHRRPPVGPGQHAEPSGQRLAHRPVPPLIDGVRPGPDPSCPGNGTHSPKEVVRDGVVDLLYPSLWCSQPHSRPGRATSLRRDRLRRRFGPEYDRAVEDADRRRER